MKKSLSHTHTHTEGGLLVCLQHIHSNGRNVNQALKLMFGFYFKQMEHEVTCLGSNGGSSRSKLVIGGRHWRPALPSIAEVGT